MSLMSHDNDGEHCVQRATYDKVRDPLILGHMRQLVADYDARIGSGVDPSCGSPIRASRDVIERMRAALQVTVTQPLERE